MNDQEIITWKEVAVEYVYVLSQRWYGENEGNSFSGFVENLPRCEPDNYKII
jgi:hypothetical protein